MTLILKKPTGAKLVLRKTWQPMDSDAAAYITAVETADNQALEEQVKIAIDNFVLGCKGDGIWNAIKASCILAGARTLAGALVPLVGTAPTNFNFVSGDYNRKTGLQNNGSKYLDSNRNNSADPQNDNHNAVYVTSWNPSFSGVAMATSNNALAPNLTRNRNITGGTNGLTVGALGFLGTSRQAAGSYLLRNQGITSVNNISSQAPDNRNMFIFARNEGGGVISASGFHRLAFYSIGESLDLALLDARVTDLINAFGAAIP